MHIINFIFFILMTLVFILLIIFSLGKKKEKISEKIINQIKYIRCILPAISLMGLILFIHLKLIFIILEVKIHFLYSLVIVICEIIITFLGAYISKNIILLIRAEAFSKKYGGRELTNKEIVYISNNNELSFLLWNYILTFTICGILYSMINEFIFNRSNILVILLMSLISTILYWFIFMEKYSE